MSNTDRIVQSFQHVLASLKIKATQGQESWSELEVGQTILKARWVSRGLPSQVRAALKERPRVDVIVAPTLSPGARALAYGAGVGWLDELGGADFAVGSVVVIRPSAQLPQKSRSWTPATFGVVEALLMGTAASTTEAAEATGLSVGTSTSALRTLTDENLLQADAARGRHSGRYLQDPNALLDAYFDEISRQNALRPIFRAGAVWRTPLEDAARLGKKFEMNGVSWAATSGLAAAVLAPHITQIAPLELYVEAQTYAELAVAAQRAGLDLIEGGGLVLSTFPSSATAKLSKAAPGTDLRCAPWPRVYADLRLRGGVRGDEAADHLREKMLAQSKDSHGR